MYDYIIVGQGLAGTVLGYTLLEKGKQVLFIDNDHEDCGSFPAAGLFNPITGKRMVKTWKAGLIFPFLETFYKNAEEKLGEKILHVKPIYKPFASMWEQNHWVSQSIFYDVESLINVKVSDEAYTPYVQNEFGGFEIVKSGYVEVKKLLLSFEKYIQGKGLLRKEKFNFDDLKISPDHVDWKGEPAKKIIFCEGYKVLQNPYFNWVGVEPAKGEIITVEMENFEAEKIINRNVFILPLGNNKYKIGSTYEWGFSDSMPTEKAKEDLIARLKEVVKVPFKVVAHEAGVRPSTRDRRPVLGLHPEFKTLGIFNGLGTKGVSLAPYFAEHFYQFLENGIELEKEASVERFQKK